MSISSVNGVASTVSRYRFVAAGGETSLSGTDANGATLSYLIGKEEVYLNGVLLVRGQDYTGTDGATISSLTALVAGDTVEIITFVPFAIPTAISSSTVTTAGDLIVATGASAVTRLGVGSSGTILTSNGTTPAYTSTITGTLNNGTLTGTLTAASTSGTSGQLLSSTGTGVQWVAAPAAGSLTLLSTTSLAGSAATTISSISQSYTHLYIYMYGITCSTSQTGLQILLSSGYGYTSGTGNYNGANDSIVDTYIRPLGAGYLKQNVANNGFGITIQNYTASNLIKPFTMSGFYSPSTGNYYSSNSGGGITSNSTVTSITIDNQSYPAWTSGTVKIYGVN